MDHQKKIYEILVDLYGNTVGIYIFGSRLDDSKKGGDIDLLIVSESYHTDEARRIRALTNLQQAIGLQKIDLILTANPATDTRVVVQEARRTGLLLESR